MQKPSMSTPTAEHCATLFVSLELSRKEWLVPMWRPEPDRISRRRVAAGDLDELLALIADPRQRAADALGRTAAVAGCHEAGHDGFWPHRRLVAAGIENPIFDPASIAVDRRARRPSSSTNTPGRAWSANRSPRSRPSAHATRIPRWPSMSVC